MAHSTLDEAYMREALRLAKKGEGLTLPNPMVGAVIVRGGRIVGRGYHRAFGSPHAEVLALSRAGSKARGATLYVTLEPCAHHGKTSPCTDAILRAGVLRVVIAARDPHRIARGGVEVLRRAGIKVTVSVCEKQARKLNEAFFTFHEKRRPFIALKFAASLDGKLATRTGDSKWITNREARKYARNLRGGYQAVLVGINTVLSDDPHLGVREKRKRDPLRVILDSRLHIPLKSKVLRDSNVLLATTARASQKKKKLLEARGIPLHVFPGARIRIGQLLSFLRRKEVISILVEGGGKIFGSFVDEKIADKVYAFYAPILIGGDCAPSIGGRGVRRLGAAPRLKNVTLKSFKGNVLIEGYFR
ncbi:bifunctional diaminohydroxyphosphoribosylaminopyrimidine deaminase/5-amino-6-(5-phosphoribosylamino)uracil reductase RibD [Candidatus Kaiserbacteria bacterium]|nr:bifunctional diaminohydroxyphosphoribosylaminopyrimidine deaminase/5-amino-6-(5-phosphoribosylamino)uracil reductase RibD [Candidatus Kaiserbacteria bacterium]